jgi:hypothetical protein
MKASTKFVAALAVATAIAFPARAMWSTQLSQPYLGHNAVLVEGMPSAMLEGREVIGMNGHRLGHVLAVDKANAVIDLQTSGAAAISLPEARLRAFGGDLLALNMTRRDVLAMERGRIGVTGG